MKKKLILFTLFVCAMLFVTNVYASSTTTKITGTNTVKVGSTTKIYIKLNTSGKIQGVDVKYSTSGNIKVTNVAIGSGLNKVSMEGNRYILYALNPIKSGSTILTLTVKGIKEGTGTVKVSKMEATVTGSEDTVYGDLKSYKITVKPAKTQEEIEKEKEEKAKEEEEKIKKEEERQLAIKKATTLVEASEKSLSQDDYDSALKSVNSLDNGTEKTKLLERLDEVKFKIAVKNECKCEPLEQEVLTCDNDKKGNGSTSWILLCIVLFGCLVIESAYLIFKISKKNEA